MAEKLRLIDWMYVCCCFDFDKQASINQQIESQRILALKDFSVCEDDSDGDNKGNGENRVR